MSQDFVCPSCKRDVNHIRIASMDAEPFDDEKKHPVRVYCCPHDDCGVIFGVAPEPAEFLEDAVLAAQDAQFAAESAQSEILSAVAGKKKKGKP